MKPQVVFETNERIMKWLPQATRACVCDTSLAFQTLNAIFQVRTCGPFPAPKRGDYVEVNSWYSEGENSGWKEENEEHTHTSNCGPKTILGQGHISCNAMTMRKAGQMMISPKVIANDPSSITLRIVSLSGSETISILSVILFGTLRYNARLLARTTVYVLSTCSSTT